MTDQLTPDGIARMFEIHHADDVHGSHQFKPVLQVIELRKISKEGMAERSKLCLSDGKVHMPGILTGGGATTGANVNLNTIIRANQWMINNVQSSKQQPGAEARSVAVLSAVDIVSHAPERIGNPIAVRDAGFHIKGGARQALAPYNGAQAQPTYGQPAAQGQYGQAPHQGGPTYGQPPPQNGSYGQPPPQNGHYGQPPAQHQPYGQPPPQMSAYGQPPGGIPQNPYGYSGDYATNPAAAAQAAMGYSAPNVMPARYENRGTTVRNTNAPVINDIKSLSPYVSRWTIKGRCSSKGELRNFTSKAGKPGCVFNFDLMDQSGEVRVVAFTDVANKFYPMVELGKMYTLSKASTKLMDNNKRKWNQTGHDCEIYLESNSLLEEVLEAEGAAIPRVHLKPVKVAEIQALEAGAIIDIVTVVESADDFSTITRRDGTEAKKRGMCVRDESGGSIEITLWGEKADDPGTAIFEAVRSGHHPSLVAKGVKVGDFNGKTLSSIGSSALFVDAMDIDGVAAVRTWYDQGGAGQKPQALSQAGKGGRVDRRATIGIVRDERLGSGQPAWIKVVSTLISIRTNLMTYPACMNDFNGRPCQKKMIDNDDADGSFYCARCSISAAPTYRYLLNIHLQDFEGQLDNVSVFGEAGESIMGFPANYAHTMEGNDELFNKHMHKIYHQLKVFKLKCAEDSYNDEVRIKYTMQSCEDINYAAESTGIIAMIEDMSLGHPIRAMKAPEPKLGGMTSPLGGPSAQGYQAQPHGVAGGMPPQGNFGGYPPQSTPAYQPAMQTQQPSYGGYNQPGGVYGAAPMMDQHMQNGGGMSYQQRYQQHPHAGVQPQHQWSNAGGHQGGAYQQAPQANTAFLDTPHFRGGGH